MGLNRSKQLDNGWINRKWLDMVLIRSRRLDNLEKWLDKPRTVGYEFDSIQTIGKWLDKSKNGWINGKWLDMGLIRSKRLNMIDS